MVAAPLFPDAIDVVSRWLNGLGTTIAQRRSQDETGQRCRSWRLPVAAPALEGSPVSLVLLHDFPLQPARLEVERRFCLCLPHIEADGHLCHGVVPFASDLDDPVAAVQRVLARLDEFLTSCLDPGWVEAEFQRECQDYWGRHAAGTSAPAAFATRELLLDVDLGASAVVEHVPALALADSGRALATTNTKDPETLAKARGWPVGTLVRGSAAVFALPLAERWTPSTWPRTFAELDALVSQLCGKPGWLVAWHSRPWPNKAPLFIVLLRGPAAFGWRVMPAHFGRMSQPVLLPLEVSRIDRAWSLCRDHNAQALADLSGKSVVVLGAGSLGAPVVELLARAGVGALDVVDPQVFEAENIARHQLGAAHVGGAKASALSAKVERDVPGVKVRAHVAHASHWLAMKRPSVDLVIDCTGEAAVRIAVSELRACRLNGAPALFAWIEPGCAAAHVVVLAGNAMWPRSDPVETAVNVARWPSGLRVELPGCGQGFHVYGMADAARAAGFVTERALAVLKGRDAEAAVWSLMRHRRFFLDVSPDAVFNREPPDADDVESVTVRRPWLEVFADET